MMTCPGSQAWWSYDDIDIIDYRMILTLLIIWWYWYFQGGRQAPGDCHRWRKGQCRLAPFLMRLSLFLCHYDSTGPQFSPCHHVPCHCYHNCDHNCSSHPDHHLMGWASAAYCDGDLHFSLSLSLFIFPFTFDRWIFSSKVWWASSSRMFFRTVLLAGADCHHYRPHHQHHDHHQCHRQNDQPFQEIQSFFSPL